jgi:hypothetical protein
MGVGIVGIVLTLGLVALIVVGAMALARRSRGPAGGDTVALGADIVTYLLMAVAVIVAVMSVANLARAAFPGTSFVFEPERQVASALAAIAVSAPIAIVLWIRQRKRRLQDAGTGGWVLYLTIVELFFTISLAIALYRTLAALILSSGTAPVTDLIVYLGAVLFHEWAVRDTPAPAAGYELPRTVGAAIGLVPLLIGIGSLIFEGLIALYEMLGGTPAFGFGVLESLVWILTGLPIWWYRWVWRWRDGHGPARRAWAIFVAAASMTVMVGALVTIVGQTLVFFFTDTRPAGSHFSFVPLTLTLLLLGLATWQHHRTVLGIDRTDTVRFYEYALAAVGVIGMIGSVTALAAIVFGPRDFLGSDPEAVIQTGTAALGSFALWYVFWSRAGAVDRPVEAPTTPRRLYLLVLGVIAAVVSAVALISVLVFVFQAILGVETLSEATVPVTALFLTSGAAAWHLLRTYAKDRALFDEEHGEIAPFEVVVVSSHPGMLAARLPREAKVRVIYRKDDQGVIDDEMADAIVESVGARPSIVWVDDTGFRVAPLR